MIRTLVNDRPVCMAVVDACGEVEAQGRKSWAGVLSELGSGMASAFAVNGRDLASQIWTSNATEEQRHNDKSSCTLRRKYGLEMGEARLETSETKERGGFSGTLLHPDRPIEFQYITDALDRQFSVNVAFTGYILHY